jgi:hypothetical protein
MGIHAAPHSQPHPSAVVSAHPAASGFHVARNSSYVRSNSNGYSLQLNVNMPPSRQKKSGFLGPKIVDPCDIPVSEVVKHFDAWELPRLAQSKICVDIPDELEALPVHCWGFTRACNPNCSDEQPPLETYVIVQHRSVPDVVRDKEGCITGYEDLNNKKLKTQISRSKSGATVQILGRVYHSEIHFDAERQLFFIPVLLHPLTGKTLVETLSTNESVGTYTYDISAFDNDEDKDREAWPLQSDTFKLETASKDPRLMTEVTVVCLDPSR